MSYIMALPYFGGKYSHLNEILPLLPVDVNCYCEPFFGSGAVLLNRKPAPIEIANDLNDQIVHFFRTLRGPRGEELVDQIALTPYSRSEFTLACDPPPDLDDVERARLWYIRIAQSRNAIPTARPSNWSFAIQHARREMAGTVSKWLNRAPDLMQVIDRIMPVQIECDDAIKVIERYDSADTLHYVDPPYVASTRTHGKVYRFEMDNSHHEELAATLKACKGKVALSGYASPLYESLYQGWFSKVFEERTIGSSSRKRTTQEVLWTNYDPSQINPPEEVQLDMFA